jgi:hypothetical protein
MLKVKTKPSAGFVYVYLQDDETGAVLKERYVRPPGPLGRLMGRTYAGKVAAAIDRLSREAGLETVKRTSFHEKLEKFCETEV